MGNLIEKENFSVKTCDINIWQLRTPGYGLLLVPSALILPGDQTVVSCPFRLLTFLLPTSEHLHE